MSEQKQSSIAQFMYKNLHLLGFQNKQRVLNVAFRELVDNSLDACAKAGILPEINAKVTYLGNREYLLNYYDNGPSILPNELPNTCCSLLYGDKFQALNSFRGQQGIGLTALFLYAQKTTGKPVRVISKIKGEQPVLFELTIDLKKNAPVIHKSQVFTEQNSLGQCGLYFQFRFHASYMGAGKKATKQLLKQYALLNPNLTLSFTDPENNLHHYERCTSQLFGLGSGNKIVPHHMQFGEFQELMKNVEEISVLDFLSSKCEGTKFHINKTISLLDFPPEIYCTKLNYIELRKLYEAILVGYEGIRPLAGRTFLLGDVIISSVTENGKIYYDYNCTFSSSPRYYEGGILQVEASAFYGNTNLPKDERITLLRVANGSPLFYQQGSCAITKAVADHDWRSSKLTHTLGELPKGSLLLIIHVSSTKIPYVTESKDSISDNVEIRSAIEECLKKISRSIRAYLIKLKAYDSRVEKQLVISSILPELKEVVSQGLAREQPPTTIALNGKIMNTIVYQLSETATHWHYTFYNPLPEEKSFNIGYYGHSSTVHCHLYPFQLANYSLEKDKELDRANTKIVFNGLSAIEYHRITPSKDK